MCVCISNCFYVFNAASVQIGYKGYWALIQLHTSGQPANPQPHECSAATTVNVAVGFTG